MARNDSRPDGAAPQADRPRGPDRRRHHPWFAHWSWAFKGRRQGLRRVDDHTNHVAALDRFEPRVLVLALTMIVLSAMDATFTLTLVERGSATEANPFMDFLMGTNVRAFVGLKIVLTGLGTIVMVAYSRALIFRRVRVEHAMVVLIGAYAALICYEMGLLGLI